MHYQDTRAEVHKLVVGPMDNNAFVLRCRRTGRSVLIDAANEPTRLAEACQELGVGLVLQTHGHWDHVQAVPGLRGAGYPVGVSPGDAAMVPSHDFLLEDDDDIEVGRLRLRIIATPGHTPGSTCFSLDGSPVLFSGDTLFPGGPGRTTSPRDFAAIIASIEDRLFSRLPAETVVMPGHGKDTTVGAERPHLGEWMERGW
jgi:glyoxylase-like metal-dependent hydrolase (beta-lactamase superfamily II)